MAEPITYHHVPFHPEQDHYEPAPDHTIRVPAVWEGERPAWLNANARRRMHWALDARLTAAWRNAGGWAAKASGIPALGPSRVIAELWMVARRRARIDPANYAPTAKACVDGLVDAGIWPDDSSGWVTGPDMRLGPVVKSMADEALVLHIWGQPCCGAATCHHGKEAA